MNSNPLKTCLNPTAYPNCSSFGTRIQQTDPLHEKSLMIPISSTKPYLFNPTLFPVNGNFFVTSLSPPNFKRSHFNRYNGVKTRTVSSSTSVTVLSNPSSDATANTTAAAQVEEQDEVEISKGYTMTQFCDKIIDMFMTEKPKTKEWRKYLVYREEWNKYKDSFYKRCQTRADTENDPIMKQRLTALVGKVKKIDQEMGRHAELLKELEENPEDINAVVARRRKDFTGEFFRHLTLLSESYENLEDRDAMARLGARCLTAVSAYDNTLEYTETLDAAQAKFDDILNSPSVGAACEKIKSLAKGKALDSSLILLINSAWASARQSTTMKNEVKDIMYQLYKTTQSSLRSIAPKEIRLLKRLLNIIDPEERFSQLASAFSPGSDQEVKDPHVLPRNCTSGLPSCLMHTISIKKTPT
ncbi:uncharacterized protein At4g37920 isoform X2 [Malania oleifera]|uniref:uncharacterized protein At4g37920 isoform X2 n=1 Tax=Malania oleifera TaxID=397392 RepID=UPI0025AEB8FF|nr:uncharacterized protein At4g37920 isoform X2 [Malania oleifera]